MTVNQADLSTVLKLVQFLINMPKLFFLRNISQICNWFLQIEVALLLKEKTCQNLSVISGNIDEFCTSAFLSLAPNELRLKVIYSQPNGNANECRKSSVICSGKLQ